MMRTSFITVTGVLALALWAGCTVKQVEPPSVAGPSTLARAITMVANKDTLFQNGVDFVDILVTSSSPTGQPQNIPLRAEIMVGGVVQDFGTLNTKNPVTPTTLRYTAPNAAPLSAGQVAQVVTITVTPTDSGDFRGEVARQVDLRLVPQGVILPTNPSLTAAFTVNPASPQAFATASFDASTTTNGTTACNNACSYSWNFGDSTSGTGLTTTHEYRTVGTYQATLTVTDSRGAQATTVRTVTVTASTPPTAVFTFSPTPAFIAQDIFFNAETSRPAAGRTISNYGWNFGDGRTASGQIVARSYPAIGTYTVTLRVTDDAGAAATTSQTVTVTNPVPLAAFTVLPASPVVGESVSFNASSSSGPSPFTAYAWNFGTGATPATATGITAVTQYGSTGNKIVTLTITDSAGRTATTTRVVAVQ